MSPTAQMLFLRLFLRSGPWFKLKTLDYSECGDPIATMDLICQAGLAVQLQSASIAEQVGVVKCLTMVELPALLASLDLYPKKSGSKPPNKSQLTKLLVDALQSPAEVRA